MTPIAWGMLLIGVAIGYILSCPIILKMLKEWHDSIEWEQQWLKSYAKITDDQYGALSTYVNDQMNLLVCHVSKLCDIMVNSHDTNADFIKAISNLFREESDKRNEWMSHISKLVESDQQVNDERWRLICEHIANKESEDITDVDDNWEA